MLASRSSLDMVMSTPPNLSKQQDGDDAKPRAPGGFESPKEGTCRKATSAAKKINALSQKQAELQKKMAGEWLRTGKYRQMHGTAPGIMANVTIMKNNTMRMQRELQKESSACSASTATSLSQRTAP